MKYLLKHRYRHKYSNMLSLVMGRFSHNTFKQNNPIWKKCFFFVTKTFSSGNQFNNNDLNRFQYSRYQLICSSLLLKVKKSFFSFFFPIMYVINCLMTRLDSISFLDQLHHKNENKKKKQLIAFEQYYSVYQIFMTTHERKKNNR